jgi:CDP-diacylglycerol--glycerol-3-phosphate 3-phosphatidyltransferase
MSEMAPRAALAHPLLTLPNLLSTSRVVLAFAFVMLESVPIRLLLLFVASLTDVLDGWLARRTHEVTRFGALVDPVADRLFVLGVVVGYVAGGQLALWQAVVIMFRDVMSVIGWFVARRVSWLRPITFKARWLGKLVTVCQLVTFVAVLLAPAATNGLVLVVGLFGLAATVDYTLMLWRERVR